VQRSDTLRESGLVVGRVGFGCDGEAFSEGKQLIESTGARENERGRVQNDVVAHPVRVGVRNKAVIGPIVSECRSEIKPNETEVVPSFPTRVVQDDKGPAWCNRVRKEVVGSAIDAVVGGYRRKISVRVEYIQGKLNLGKKCGPVVYRE
jgi:hypothetical protein